MSGVNSAAAGQSSPAINTHNVVITFGKHKGERWTRVPVSYLKWILNEMSPSQEAYKYAEAELARRGDTMPSEVDISNHAIDKASLRVRKCWHHDRGRDEGLYSWLARICAEAQELSAGQERIKHKGCVLVFEYGNFYPTLKTVMNDKSYVLPQGIAGRLV